MNQIVLAIDTSCDETSAAITRGRRVLSNVLASQVEIHRKYGGVFPTEAKRLHREKIEPVTREAVRRAGLKLDQVEAVAVTVGPGLAPALEVGIAWAKKISLKQKIPLVPVSHLEGHLLSALALNSKGKGTVGFNISNQSNYPILGIIVSGGHTELVRVDWLGKYEVLGRSLDDAAGECLDKVGRMLGLSYPAGAVIEELAKQPGGRRLELPLPMLGSGDLQMSFSGLKTACLYLVESELSSGNWKKQGHNQAEVERIKRGELTGLSREFVVGMAAAVQAAVVRVVCLKAGLAAKQIGARAVFLGGGVGANRELRKGLRREMKPLGIKLYTPYSRRLYTDNAAMIGLVGGLRLDRGEAAAELSGVERQPRLGL